MNNNIDWFNPYIVPEGPVPWLRMDHNRVGKAHHVAAQLKGDKLQKNPSGPQGEGLKHKNKWIEHVKEYAKKHKMSYQIALKEAKRSQENL